MFTLGDVGETVTLGDAGGDCHAQGWWWDCSDCRPRGNAGWECRLRDGAFKDFGKVNDGLLLGVTELGKWICRRWVGEGLCQGSRCDDGCIDGECCGDWALVWKELHCLGGALSSGLGNIETVAAIVFWGGT